MKERTGVWAVAVVAYREVRDSCVDEWVFVRAGEGVWCIEDVSDSLYLQLRRIRRLLPVRYHDVPTGVRECTVGA